MIEGFDVSIYQSKTPSLIGKDFLFARASIGTLADPKFRQHIDNAKRAGLVTGAYHFGTGSSAIHRQVSVFLANSSDVDLWVLDLEGSPVPMTNAQARAFITAVKATGRKIGLYHSDSGFPSIGQDYNWVANWSRPPHTNWVFWQDGGENGIDHNFYKGTRAELNAFVGRDMAGLNVTKMQRFVGEVEVVTPGTKAVDVSEPTKTTAINVGVRKEAFYKGILAIPIAGGLPGEDRSTVYGIGEEEAVLLASNVKPIPFVPPAPPPPDCTTQIAAAIKADRAKAHIETKIVYE